MPRALSILLLLAAVIDAPEASATIFSALPAPPQGAVSQLATVPNLLPPSAVQSAQGSTPLVENPHVPVYQTYALPPPKPPKPNPIFVPDSQNVSRRRHLGW
jgi:hypothetical protein